MTNIIKQHQARGLLIKHNSADATGTYPESAYLRQGEVKYRADDGQDNEVVADHHYHPITMLINQALDSAPRPSLHLGY